MTRLLPALTRLFAVSLLVLFAAGTRAADDAPSADEKAFMAAVQALGWVKGPTTVEVTGNAKLKVPEGFVYLDARGTNKVLELNQNLGSGEEVMIAPQSLEWSAYFSFTDDGYVKDDEKIDADALLKTMKEGTEQANEERKRRGWESIHVVDWAVPPNYNSATQRLEWATTLQSESGRSVNFFTKILGRRGHTTVVLATAPSRLDAAERSLNDVLGGYAFNTGDRYAEYQPGDKVAQYGLAALVLGGAAAIATKKGFWAVAAAFFATAWKFIAAGVVAAVAGLRGRFARKRD